MEGQTFLDQTSNFVFGVFDRVAQGVSTYFDGAIQFNEAKAALNQSKADRDKVNILDNLAVGTKSSTLGDPDNVLDFNLNSAQGMLVIAGLGLAVFAIARAK